MSYRPFNYIVDLSRFSVDKHEIKETLFKEEKRLVEINISYPQPKKDCFEEKANKNISSFYKKIAENFASFAKKRLYNLASETIKDGDKPFSAVIKFIPTFENDVLISIVLDAFIFYNEKRSETKRLSHIFLKSKYGMLSFNDFFSKGSKQKIIEFIESNFESHGKLPDSSTIDKSSPKEKIRKNFSTTNFFLSPYGYGFYFNAGILTDSTFPQVYIMNYNYLSDIKSKQYLSMLLDDSSSKSNNEN